MRQDRRLAVSPQFARRTGFCYNVLVEWRWGALRCVHSVRPHPIAAPHIHLVNQELLLLSFIHQSGAPAWAFFLPLCFLSIAAGQEERYWTEARLRMVREEVAAAGIENPRVLEALRQTPRHQFVSHSQRHLAYYDMALPIGEGQTISPPFVVASMTQALDPQPSDKVLEIGTGSGYQAAVLGHLVAEVYSIEIVEPLGRTAGRTLRRLGYDNVHTKVGDGFLGWPQHAPFDKIIVTCSPERIPQALVDQLREGGRMVIPLGERYQQTLYLFRKVKGKMEAEALEPTYFVPMTGRAEEARQVKDPGPPRVVNGAFEETDEAGLLAPWYYIRQAEVVADSQAPEGERFLRFSNETPGRGAHAAQALPMDGRRTEHVEVSVWAAADSVLPGQSRKELGRLEITFYDERRASLGTHVLGPWFGTSDWTRHRMALRVPPQSRLAVVAIGLFGAVGELSVDDVTVRTSLAGDSPN
ncbi:MAG: protein-L-isoaspartate(D-aspartate) O-methyltransferase [Planctomycetes bacterium]|nr:protein-L-isoaspartate(D-aspartate) O-methyltransferase [Planctomycetota bacterium]